jgi:hypothetical protein
MPCYIHDFVYEMDDDGLVSGVCANCGFVWVSPDDLEEPCEERPRHRWRSTFGGPSFECPTRPSYWDS